MLLHLHAFTFILRLSRVSSYLNTDAGISHGLWACGRYRTCAHLSSFTASRLCASVPASMLLITICRVAPFCTAFTCLPVFGVELAPMSVPMRTLTAAAAAMGKACWNARNAENVSFINLSKTRMTFRNKSAHSQAYIIIICVIYSAALCRAARRYSLRPSSFFDFRGRSSGEHSAPSPLRPSSDLNGQYPCLFSFGVQWGNSIILNMYGSLSKNPSSKAVMSGLEPVRTPLGADLRKCEMLSACLNQAESVSFLIFFLGKWENLHNFALD